MRKYRKEMENGRKRLHQELIEALYQYIETLKVKMDEQFTKFDSLIQEETDALTGLQSELNGISTRMDGIRKIVAKAF